MKTCERHQISFPDGGCCPGCVAAMVLSEDEKEAATPFARLGDYELISELGRGGMGVVYLARQIGLNRRVALKLLPSGSLAGKEFIQRFRREGELAASLQHPNIVRIFEAAEADGELFFSMELVDGGSLADWREGKTQRPADAAKLLRTLALAVAHAHAKGVLHRDLKPSNVLVDEDGNPKVADFGLARLLDSDGEVTMATHSFGSPAYMAPELIRDPKAAAPASDIYSLGAILYFLLTGRSPFVSASLDELLRQVRETEPAAPRLLNPAVPKDLQKICLKALDKNPARRYPAAPDLAEDLQRFIEGRPVLARPVGPLAKAARMARRSPWLTAATACFVIALLDGIIATARQARIANERADETARTARQLRLNLYASDIANASIALQRGDAPLASEVLARWENPPAGEDPRGFEWELLRQESRPAAHKLLGRRDATVTSLALSPDDSRLAIADQGGKVSIRPPDGNRPYEFPEWSADEIAALPGGGWVAGDRSGDIRWIDASGKTIARARGRQFSLARQVTRAVIGESSRFHWWVRGGAAHVLDWKTGERLLEIPGDWRQAVISPDGRTVALAAIGGGLRLMDVATGTIRELPTPTPVWGLAFNHDGTSLAAGSRRAAMIWNLADESPAPTILPHNLTVWMTAFSDDGGKFLTSSSDRRVRVWQTDHLTAPPLTLAGHRSEVWCATFSHDGGTVFAGGKDGDVLSWEISSHGSTGIIIPHDQPVAPFFLPDGRLVVRSQDRTRILDSAADTDTYLPQGIRALGVTQDGKSIIIADARGVTGRATISSPDKITLNPMAPPGGDVRYLRGCGSGRWIARILKDGAITLEDPADGRTVHRFRGPADGMRHAIAASKDGRYFAICGDGYPEMVLHDLKAGLEYKLGPKSSYYYVGVTFSHDGTLLAAGDLSGPIQVWRLADRKLVASLPGHPEETSAVAFSPDGRTLASMGFHQDLKFWHTATWRELHSINVPDATFNLVFSPDGKRLLATLGSTRNEWIEFFPAGAAAE